MKKNLILTVMILSCTAAYAEAPLPSPIIQDINHSIYSTDATKPFSSVEKNYYTNNEIIRLEKKKQKPQEEDVEMVEVSNPVVKEKPKMKLRYLFSGFKVEW